MLRYVYLCCCLQRLEKYAPEQWKWRWKCAPERWLRNCVSGLRSLRLLYAGCSMLLPNGCSLPALLNCGMKRSHWSMYGLLKRWLSSCERMTVRWCSSCSTKSYWWMRILNLRCDGLPGWLSLSGSCNKRDGGDDDRNSNSSNCCNTNNTTGRNIRSNMDGTIRSDKANTMMNSRDNPIQNSCSIRSTNGRMDRNTMGRNN